MSALQVSDMAVPEAFLEHGIRMSPAGRRFWVEPEMLRRDRQGRPWPWFRMGTVCRAFFGRSESWLRMRLRPTDAYPEGDLLLDGQPLTFRRSDSQARSRLFTLADIERMAHALHQQGHITDTQLLCAVQTVIWIGRQHGILTE